MPRTNPFDKQFEKDLKANENASDKLDKELNKPEEFATKTVLKSENEPVKEIEAVSAKNDDKPTPKERILEEYGGLEANIPKYHHYWQLP